VRKVIRGHRTEFKYERAVQPSPKLADWVEVLTEILEQEADLPKRERRSTQRLFEELRGRGYDGAHDSVHRFAKAWRGERARVPAKAYVPMSFAPGEAFQFDWSHETITLRGLPWAFGTSLPHRPRLCELARSRREGALPSHSLCRVPSLARSPQAKIDCGCAR
jgi:hypothetical protein